MTTKEAFPDKFEIREDRELLIKIIITIAKSNGFIVDKHVVSLFLYDLCSELSYKDESRLNSYMVLAFNILDLIEDKLNNEYTNY